MEGLFSPSYITLSLLSTATGKKVSKNIYTCPCPGSGAKDMPSSEFTILFAIILKITFTDCIIDVIRVMQIFMKIQ